MRILVNQLAKLGDFIQSTALLRNLKDTRPDAELTLAALDPAVLEAARLFPLLDQVWTPRSENDIPIQTFDEVYNLNSHPRAIALTDRVRAGRIFGPRTGPDGTTLYSPAQRFLLSLMSWNRRYGSFNLVDVWQSLGPNPQPAPLLWPRPTALPDLPEGYRLGLVLGCRGHLRRWPVEHHLALARDLLEVTGLQPVLLGAAGERALGARFLDLAAATDLTPLNLIGQTDLETLAGTLSRLSLVVSADTGVMHLAAALKVPTLGLFFGPAFGPETGPYGSGHIIYQTLADCGPCREGECRRRHCLLRPEPSTALQLALNILSGCDDTPDLPPGHYAWRTVMDAFGQALRPLGRPVDADEALCGLILREAGRAVLRPGYRPVPEAIALLGSSAGVPNVSFIKQAFSKGPWASNEEAENFLFKVNMLANVCRKNSTPRL